MSKYVRRIEPKAWLICGLAAWLSAIAVVAAGASAQASTATVAPNNPQPAPNTSRSAPPSTDWSASDCAECHDKAAGPAFARTAHGKQDQSCAKCHQNVAEHLKSITAGTPGGPVPTLKKLKPNELNAVCLTCHEKANQSSFLSSMHARRNVACSTCHSVHDYKSETAQLKTRTDTETCVTCHKAERAKSMRTSHHPVREGKLGCASCHNPHEGSRPKQLKADSVNELCYKCHTEKRGPFLYEHGPVREDCATCHDPHGSNQERLLVAKAPFLCQRCHYSGHGITGDNSNTLKGPAIAAPNPPGVTVTQTARSSRQMERSCKQCHIAIHGSNSASGWAFVR
jgi:DmsE family decaheme c-type cytochrome